MAVMVVAVRYRNPRREDRVSSSSSGLHRFCFQNTALRHGRALCDTAFFHGRRVFILTRTAAACLGMEARKLGDAVSRRGRLRSTSGLVLWLKLRVGESRKSCIHATRRRWRLRAMIRTDAEMASPLQGEIG